MDQHRRRAWGGGRTNLTGTENRMQHGAWQPDNRWEMSQQEPMKQQSNTGRGKLQNTRTIPWRNNTNTASKRWPFGSPKTQKITDGIFEVQLTRWPSESVSTQVVSSNPWVSRTNYFPFSFSLFESPQLISLIPLFAFTSDGLPDTTLCIYPGLGPAPKEPGLGSLSWLHLIQKNET